MAWIHIFRYYIRINLKAGHKQNVLFIPKFVARKMMYRLEIRREEGASY